ncbi:Dual specificity protein kinase [Alternaria tenuissima]|uniref:dual-specificity kinase n=2 Tax=Alternaria alternata complex TaxID=187734 RepID=A0A4Q4MYX3_ALTAL|nr:kinase-like domain-containing protein [Alternaria alternata]RYN23051.1 Dual specificity protein kinase [Alternaria tenuissima]OWY57573.1 kinase-like protein [Alternaria alternata]RYN63953.1 Dual specificity protein kinase [Alternaria alternata]RYN88002.1 Dual specificity protein kinase [Alternaria tenuissima]
MSTPSTATATLPPHHQFYSHHQTYQPSMSNAQIANGSARIGNSLYNGYASASSSSDLRRNATAHTRHPPQLPPITQASPIDMAANDPGSAQRRRNPDWADFYRNGIPKEVIVIDDDDDDDAQLPPPRQQPPSSRGIATNPAARHTDKKRKTTASTAYDPVYNQHTSYSTTQTPYYDSPNHSLSTDRTTSALNTTAPTSLGSQVSNGHHISPLENSAAGQKRKRTRAVVQDEAKQAKRRELDNDDPFSLYQPPPNPVIKAKDVYVQVVQDKSYTKDQKVDDEDGHYIVVPEADLTERYQITKLLGQGTFGKVVQAYDRRKGTNCAIKVIRSVPKYRDASRIELRVLSTLASNDKHNINRCIHLRDCFDFRNHICIVTDLYGQSVFDFLKSNGFVPFPSSHIQKFAKQLFTSVAFLHDLNLIHTDLKPENILLVNNNYQTFTYNRTVPSSSTTVNRTARHRKVLLDPEIRLIDFGSATFNDEYHSSVVSTRHYRAPEIILNLGWSFPCDIWSIGCILVEFFTGDALFQTHDNLEHLAMMEAVCSGKIDRDIVRAVYKQDRGSSRNSSSSAARYFKNYKLDYPNADTNKASKKYVKAMKKLPETIPAHTDFNRQFLDLLRRIFVYDPKKRITAKEALQHPWFKESLMDDGTEAHKIRLEREKKARRAEEERRFREQTQRAY